MSQDLDKLFQMISKEFKQFPNIAYPTFILARCSRLLGLRSVFFASGVAGGDIARLISSTVGPCGV